MMCSLTYPEKNKKQIFTTDAKIKAAVVRGGDNLSPRIDQSYIRATDWKSWRRSPETKKSDLERSGSGPPQKNLHFEALESVLCVRPSFSGHFNPNEPQSRTFLKRSTGQGLKEKIQ